MDMVSGNKTPIDATISSQNIDVSVQSSQNQQQNQTQTQTQAIKHVVSELRS
jgi:hypothetical protein